MRIFVVIGFLLLFVNLYGQQQIQGKATTAMVRLQSKYNIDPKIAINVTTNQGKFRQTMNVFDRTSQVLLSPEYRIAPIIDRS